MFRTKLARLTCVAASLFLAGCTSNSCCDRPGLFSRDRPPLFGSRTSVAVSTGGCCEGTPTSGPYLPPVSQPGTIVNPQQPIPRIDENGKQIPWDPSKPTAQNGIKTATNGR